MNTPAGDEVKVRTFRLTSNLGNGNVVAAFDAVAVQAYITAVAYVDSDNINGAVFVTSSQNSGIVNGIPNSTTLATQVKGLLTTNCWYWGAFTNAPATAGWTHTASGPAAVPQDSSFSFGFGPSGSPNLSVAADRWVLTALSFRTKTPAVLVTPPSINGTPQVGVVSSYTQAVVTNGTFSSRQWKVAGVNVSAAATYTPVLADVGKSLTIQETWTNADGNVVTTSSGKTIIAALLPPTASAWFNYLQQQNLL
jgi:hypothetical protein